MIVFSLFFLILAIVLFKHSFDNKNIVKLSSLTLFYSGLLTMILFETNLIGGGISLYGGFFQVTVLSVFFDVFLFFLGCLAMLPWPIYSLNIMDANIIRQSEKENKHFFVNMENISNDKGYKKNLIYLLNNTNIYSNYKESLSILLKNLKNNWPYNFNIPMKEFSLFLLFTIMGGSFLISSSDLISVYISIELQSFGIYLYTALYREKESSISAALKYYLLGSLSSCFILLGSVLMYSYTGLTQFDSIYSFISVTKDQLYFTSYIYDFYLQVLCYLNLDNMVFNNALSTGIFLSLLFFLCGFFFKISAAPFHNWAPDVYDGTPTIVTTWLTIIPKLTILIFLLEFINGISISLDAFVLNIGELLNSYWNLNSFTTFKYDLISDFSLDFILIKEYLDIWYQSGYLDLDTSFIVNEIIGNKGSLNVLQNLILICSLLSLVLGTVVGLSQVRIKRLLAFSTISHVGFLLLVLSLNTDNSIQSFIFYILQYSITNLDLFFILLGFSYILYQVKELKNISPIFWQYLPLNKNYKNSSSDIVFIEDLNGLMKIVPLLSISFSICLFSMAGTPPLLGFFAKQQLLYATLYSGLFFLSFVGITVSVISASYYLKIIKVLCFSSYNSMNTDNSNSIIDTKTKTIITENGLIEKKWEVLVKNNLWSIINQYHSFIISVLTLFILLFILNSSILLNSAQLLAESTFFI